MAFIGSTGSGKSTLVNLIPRFYDVSDGEILVDGVNVQDYALEDLRNKVGYIPQKAVLFSGDVKGNLDFGQSQETPLSEQAMWRALELAQSKNFIEDKEAGLASEVAQGGTNFSGGQRQRLQDRSCPTPRVSRENQVYDQTYRRTAYFNDYGCRFDFGLGSRKSRGTRHPQGTFS